LGEGGSGK